MVLAARFGGIQKQNKEVDGSMMEAVDSDPDEYIVLVPTKKYRMAQKHFEPKTHP